MEENKPVTDTDLEQILAEAAASLADLSSTIPQQPDLNFHQKRVDYQEEIDDVNTRVEAEMVETRAKLVNHYIECEKGRLEQQRPLLMSVIKINTTLIWLFNIVIGIITISAIVLCFVQSDTSILDGLFDFLKYYVGAVVVELIGMLFFIVRGVFSFDYKKIMESVLNTETKKNKK